MVRCRRTDQPHRSGRRFDLVALLREYHLSQCLSVVSRPTLARKVHPAVVWRQSGRLDDGDAGLPSVAVRRLSVCTPDVAAVHALAGDAAHTAVAGRDGHAADCTRCRLEADRYGVAHAANRRVADGLRGPAVLPVVGDRPADSKLAREDARGTIPISVVRTLERGFIAGTAGLSIGL